MLRRPLVALAVVFLVLPACAARARKPVAPPVAAAPASPTAPTIRAIVVEGSTNYDELQVQAILRVRPGDSLWRDATLHATTLQDRFHTAGYVAARVTGTFEPDTGTLRLRVDEGRLAEVVLEGVDPGVADETRERLGLATGSVVRESEIRAAMVRLEDASLGAFARADWPGYEVVHTDAGVRLTLRFVQRRWRVAIVPGGGVGAPWNRVDGVQPWLGAELTRYDAGSFRHTNAYARAGWGVSSHDVRWAAGIRRPFGGGDRLTVGYEHHDLTDTDDLFPASMFEQAPATVLVLGEQGDHFRRQGDEGYAFLAVTPRLQAGLAFRSDEHEPLFDEDAETPRPSARAGLSRSVVGTVRVSRGGPLFENARRQRESFLQRDLFGTRLERRNSLRAEASLEWADAESLGGAFTFRRLLLNVRGEHAVSTRVRLRARGLAGFTGGDVPPQRALGLGGPGTLRAREYDSVTGDHVVLLNVEAALEAPARWPGPVVFYDGGTAWGDSTEGIGWRSDVGLGLEWPAGSGYFLRVDGAWALDPLPRDDRFRVTGRVRLPF